MIGASLFLGGSVKAEVDYQGIAYLGGGDKIDLNNANIREIGRASCRERV